MQAEPVPAPETKAAETTGDVAGAFEDFMTTFEAFKAENDSRLAEIEHKRVADVLTVEKVDRINRALDEQKRLVDSLVLKIRRPQLGRDGQPLSANAIEHKAAFDAYVRGGAEEALRAHGAEGALGRLRRRLSGARRDRARDRPAPVGGFADPRHRRRAPGLRQRPTRSPSSPPAPPPAGSARPTSAACRPKRRRSASSSSRPWSSTPCRRRPVRSSTTRPSTWTSGWRARWGTVFAEQEGTAFVTGDGDKKPTGFLSYTTIAEASWAWEKIGYIATGVDGAWPAATPSDILVDLVYALKAGYRQNGTWVMNRASQAAIRKMKDDSDNYIWQPAAVAGQPASLMNFPIAESEDMPDIGSDAFAIAFGDFRRGYLIVDRVGVRVLRDPYSAKPYVLFYTTKRVGGGVQDYDAIKLLKFGTA